MRHAHHRRWNISQRGVVSTTNSHGHYLFRYGLYGKIMVPLRFCGHACSMLKISKIYNWLSPLGSDDGLSINQLINLNQSITRFFSQPGLALGLLRSRYYFAYYLSESVNNLAGLGFDGCDSKGKPNWDLINNVEINKVQRFCDLLSIALGFSHSIVIQNFNYLIIKCPWLLWCPLLSFESQTVSISLKGRAYNLNCKFNLLGFDTIEINLVTQIWEKLMPAHAQRVGTQMNNLILAKNPQGSS